MKPSSQFGVTGHVRSKLVTLNIFRLGATKIAPTALSWSLKPVPGCLFDFDLTWWVVTWPYCLRGQNLHTRCIIQSCASLPYLATRRASIFDLFAKNRWGRQKLPPFSARVYPRLCSTFCHFRQWRGGLYDPPGASNIGVGPLFNNNNKKKTSGMDSTSTRDWWPVLQLGQYLI